MKSSLVILFSSEKEKPTIQVHYQVLIPFRIHFTGIAGLMNCIRKEHGGSNARYVFIQDKGVANFSPTAAPYANQLNQQLTANVLKNGKWGSFRHLSLDEQSTTPTKIVEHAHINTMISGDLSSTRWVESSLSHRRNDDEAMDNFCYIYYAPINFRLKAIRMILLLFKRVF